MLDFGVMPFVNCYSLIAQVHLDVNFVLLMAIIYGYQIIAQENHPVQWTTPLGLPVVQPYRKIGRHLVSINLNTF